MFIDFKFVKLRVTEYSSIHNQYISVVTDFLEMLFH